jgi:hypothetical protein
MDTIQGFIKFFDGLDNLRELLQGNDFLKNEKIPPRIKLILNDYFVRGKNCVQIGRTQGVTGSRINNLLKKGFLYLKKFDEQRKGNKIITDTDISELKVEDMRLICRTTNVLINNDILFLRDILIMSPTEFLRYRNAGRKSLRELEERLQGLGLKVGMYSHGVDFCDYIMKICSGRTFTQEEVEKITFFLKSRIKQGEARGINP